MARSGPELVRYQSRGTNINPFTPAEQRDKASPGGGRTSLFVANSEPKPHKVRMHVQHRACRDMHGSQELPGKSYLAWEVWNSTATLDSC